MGAGRIGLAAVVLALLAAGVTGCGGANELRSAKQAPTFIDDVLEGGAGGWKLADDADQAAIGLWIDRVMIESLGTRLKQVGSEWGCDVANVTTQVRESFDQGYLEISPEARERILAEYAYSATPAEINQVIDETWAVGLYGGTKVVDVACGLDG